MVNGVRRISVAVHDLGSALAFYRDALGLPVVAEFDLLDRGLKLVRLDARGTLIELMQPTDSTGPVADFLRQRGEGLHHMAIDVEDIELEIRTLLARGTEMLDREPREGPEGRIAFVHPRSTGGVMIELHEPSRSPEPRILPESAGQTGEPRTGEDNLNDPGRSQPPGAAEGLP